MIWILKELVVDYSWFDKLGLLYHLKMVSLAVALFDAFLLPLLLLSKYINKIKTTLNTSKLLFYMYKFKAIFNIPFCFCEAYCCLPWCICEFDCLFYSKMTKLVSDKSMWIWFSLYSGCVLYDMDIVGSDFRFANFWLRILFYNILQPEYVLLVEFEYLFSPFRTTLDKTWNTGSLYRLTTTYAESKWNICVIFTAPRNIFNRHFDVI